MQKKLPTLENFKLEAKNLRKENKNITTHGQALNLLALEYGYKDWKTLSPLLAGPKENLIKKYGLIDLSVKYLTEDESLYFSIPGHSKMERPFLFTFEIRTGKTLIGRVVCADVTVEQTYSLGQDVSWSDIRKFRRQFYSVKDHMREEVEDNTEVEEVLSSNNADYIFTHAKGEFSYPSVCVVLDMEVGDFMDEESEENEEEICAERGEIKMLLLEKILSFEDISFSEYQSEEFEGTFFECYLFPPYFISDMTRMKKSLKKNKKFKTKALPEFRGFGEAGFTLIRSKNFRGNRKVEIHKEFPLIEEEKESYEMAMQKYGKYFDHFALDAEPFYLKKYSHDDSFFTDNSMILSIVRAVKNERNPLIDAISRLAEEEGTSIDIYWYSKEEVELIRKAFMGASMVMQHDADKSIKLVTMAKRLKEISINMRGKETLDTDVFLNLCGFSF